ncbi:HD domain-containing protein [bacterium]|nr:HD domain-containing protein [bacterium]
MLHTNSDKTGENIEQTASEHFEKSLVEFEKNDYTKAYDDITEAHKCYLSAKNMEMVSCCLSLMGLFKYYLEPETYYKSLLIIEDAKFLAENIDSKLAQGINKFALGQIVFVEGNFREAVLYLENAALLLDKNLYLKIKALESLSVAQYKMGNLEKSYRAITTGIDIAKCANFTQFEERLTKIAKDIKYSSQINADSKVEPDSDEPKKNVIDPMIALLKIARTINAQIDLDSLLVTIAEQTRLALNADRCTVFLIDKEKKELWSKVALGMDSKVIRFQMDKGLAGHVAMTGETIHIKDAYNDSRFNKEIDLQTGYKTKNILCMPIRNIKYEIIGVFQVLNKYDGEFTDNDEDLLLTIGSSAGIAIENNILLTIQQKMIKEQEKMFSSFIDTLAASIDARDKITMGHSRRVGLYAELIARMLGLDDLKIEVIIKAAMLHDIGKIGIRDSVLQKEGKLTDEEYEHIKQHVEITHDILSKINLSEGFKEIVEIASTHHEKYNGTGYYKKISGEDIPLGGRILAVADVFDAITSKRHYRDKMPIQNALKIIVEGKNAHFDEKVVNAFMSSPCDKIINIFLTEYSEIMIKDYDQRLLASRTLEDLYGYLQKEEPSKEEAEFIDLFNGYYILKSEKKLAD